MFCTLAFAWCITGWSISIQDWQVCALSHAAKTNSRACKLAYGRLIWVKHPRVNVDTLLFCKNNLLRNNAVKNLKVEDFLAL
jgi:hypothetical protein